MKIVSDLEINPEGVRDHLRRAEDLRVDDTVARLARMRAHVASIDPEYGDPDLYELVELTPENTPFLFHSPLAKLCLAP